MEIKELNGVIGIIKPSGIYSTKVLGRVKFLLRQELKQRSEHCELGTVRCKLPKVGHFGTLDENAAGILVVAIGKATKLNNQFSEKKKTYESVFKFGIETDTLDPLGKITREEKTNLTKAEIEAQIKQFIGKIEQLPPKYSANKINGQRAYDLARAGQDVELKYKAVEIFEFKLISFNRQQQEAKVLIECSTGTYVRSLARDLAAKLNTVAIAKTINRTVTGQFNYNNSIKFEDLSFKELWEKLNG